MAAGVGMQTAAAAAPVLLVLVLMLWAGWSAARAGLVGLALALVLAVTVFGFDPLVHGAGVLAEGGFITLTVLWILLPALALHQHQQAAGALDALRRGLTRLTDRPALQVLLVGWCLALFFEGAAGFGTPVALAAPLLVGLGVPPVQAVVLALLGHAVGVSFGALGTPTLVQSTLTGLDATAIAWRAAALHAVLGGLMMVFFLRALAGGGDAAGAVAAGQAGGTAGHGARTAAPGGPASATPWAWGALAALSFLLPALALAAWLGPELATLGAALVCSAVMALGLRWQGRRGHGLTGQAKGAATTPATTPAASFGASALPLSRALAPYAVLVVLVLASRAWPPLAEALAATVWEWQLQDRFSGRFQPLLHPGTLLAAALVLGVWAQGRGLAPLRPALATAVRQLLPVTVALLAMLCLSRLMLHAGMVDALQRAAVQTLGAGWPWVAPAVGALGSFVTGSATASNVLFTGLQVQTAQALGLSAPWMAAGQGLGAAVGNIVCPHNIVAGAATVGLAGREGEVLRQTLWPCLVYLALGGALLAAVMRWGPAVG